MMASCITCDLMRLQDRDEYWRYVGMVCSATGEPLIDVLHEKECNDFVPDRKMNWIFNSDGNYKDWI